MILNFNDFLFENKKNDNSKVHDFACVMLELTHPDWKSITSIIDEDDLYYDTEEDGYGIEEEPHVTILYGIHDDEVSDEVVISEMEHFVAPLIRLKAITCFENEKYDVVKFDVESQDLHDINNYLREILPYTSEYLDYKPHATIAYVKSGMGKKYMKDLDEPLEFKLPNVFYSKTNGEKIKFVLQDLKNEKGA
jgi:hypothetical protein